MRVANPLRSSSRVFAIGEKIGRRDHRAFLQADAALTATSSVTRVALRHEWRSPQQSGEQRRAISHAQNRCLSRTKKLIGSAGVETDFAA